MLSTVRKLLDSWVARVFFALLVFLFLFWGVSNVMTLAGGSTAVAHIGGAPVDMAAVQAAYQQQLQQIQQNGTGQPDLPTRQRLAGAALGQVLRAKALRLAEADYGLAAPPAAIRAVVDNEAAFQTAGRFDPRKFNQVLQANGRTPDAYLADVRDDVLGRQLVLPVIATAQPPALLTAQIFDFVAQQRFAETVTVPFGGQAPPAPPPDALLQRYWRNHQGRFGSPEIRDVQLVILSPALLAPREVVSDAAVAAASAQAVAGVQAQPERSVRLVVARDAAKAAQLAALWKGGADWPAVQKAARAAGANPVSMNGAQRADFPSPQMADAVFAAPAGQVTGPVAGPFGFFVFQVTADTGQAAKPALLAAARQALQLQKAQADVAQDVNGLQDALAGQTPLDKLPSNLGLVALEGTLDGSGNTAEGVPAPVPGGPALKAAVVKAAFAAHVGDAPQLVSQPDGSYFALSVLRVIPPAVKPYADVKDAVLAAWTQDARVKAAEAKAAALFHAASGGGDLDSAASAAGLAVTMTPPVTRSAQAAGVPVQMVQVLFSLKPGQATMLQTDAGFTVAVLSRIVQPSPADDPADYQNVQADLARAMQNDIGQSFIAGLESRYHVTVNQKLFQQIYQ